MGATWTYKATGEVQGHPAYRASVTWCHTEEEEQQKEEVEEEEEEEEEE